MKGSPTTLETEAGEITGDGNGPTQHLHSLGTPAPSRRDQVPSVERDKATPYLRHSRHNIRLPIRF